MAHTLTACQLPESEAHALVAKVKNANAFMVYGIDVNLGPCEDGEDAPKRLAVNVTAESPVQAGIGKGYILAIVGG